MSIENLYPGPGDAHCRWRWAITRLWTTASFIRVVRAGWTTDCRPHGAWGLDESDVAPRRTFPAVPRGVELRAEPGVRNRNRYSRPLSRGEKLVWWPKVVFRRRLVSALV